MAKHPKILLIGTGAIGSFYGGKLSQSEAHVAALCRSDYEIVKKNGISIKSINGDFLFMPDEIVNNISQYSSIPDYIIVATKVLPEINIPEMIKEKVYPNTSIVLLQNGIDIEKPAVKAFPNNEIINALAFICVSRYEFGYVDHQDYGRIVIGKYPQGSSEKVDLLASLFNKAGIDCQIDMDTISARWKKLIWNAPFNPISVLGGGVDTKSIVECEPTLHLAKKIMEEVVLLAEKSGHPVHESLIQKNLDDTFSMKPYKTSMLLDYENHRPMEVEAILGNALHIARNYHVPVPYLESIYGLLTLINKNRTRLRD